MKIEVTKAWCLAAAQREEDAEIGASAHENGGVGAMWVVYKLNSAGRRMWYCGMDGHWSSTTDRAALWIDQRDAAAVAAFLNCRHDFIRIPTRKTERI